LGYLLVSPVVSFGYHWCIFLLSSVVSSEYLYGIFWLPLWYLLVTPVVSSDRGTQKMPLG
jgi:hypothetical protein